MDDAAVRGDELRHDDRRLVKRTGGGLLTMHVHQRVRDFHVHVARQILLVVVDDALNVSGHVSGVHRVNCSTQGARALKVGEFIFLLPTAHRRLVQAVHGHKVHVHGKNVCGSGCSL